MSIGVIRAHVLSSRFGGAISVWPHTKCTTAAYIFGLLSVMLVVDHMTIMLREEWWLPRVDEEWLKTRGLVVERKI